LGKRSFTVLNKDVYAVTPKGQTELSGSATLISAAELDVLVRLDGVLTVEQVRLGMSPEAMPLFDRHLDLLVDKGLAAAVRMTDFMATGRFDFHALSMSQAGFEADMCASSLKKSSYYVRIARKHDRVRVRAPGEMYSAVIVDDEPQLAKFLGHYLTFEGFDVRIASCREEIVTEFRKSPVPDLILLDVMMPDVDGFDVLLRIRAHPALRQVPVIMLTAKATRESVLKGLAGGADGYVTKPVETESLLQAVRTVMGMN
jgi:CheY-like chemotaxis protein